MKIYKGFEGIDYTEWILLKMIIKIYGEDKLIEVLKLIKEFGGIEGCRTITK